MMDEPIIIENASIKDLPEIEYLLKDLIDTVDNSNGFCLESSIDNCRRIIADPDSYILLAKSEGKITGLINFTTRRTILHSARSGLIDELVVAKSYRNKKIGTQLIKAAIKKCSELGCCEIEVSTEKTNEKARAFYKKCGFDENAVFLEYELD